jgi:beta-glucosidase/6-phospho-beta-glucosidase/beta-galactosidase
MANLLEAHGRAYRVIHEEDRGDADGDGRAARVGFAKNYPLLEPHRPWFPLDVLRAWLEQRVFNQAVLEAPRSGTIDLSIPGARAARRHVAELANSLDYIGLNYYTRWQVKMFAPDPHVAPLGAIVYPYDGDDAFQGGAGDDTLGVTFAAGSKYGLGSYDGVADATDRLRPRALVESVLHLARAMERGAKVEGYFHWSLTDNFEWADGYRGRFGLYQVDFSDPERRRTRTRSAELYARIAASNAIDADTWRAATGELELPAALR